MHVILWSHVKEYGFFPISRSLSKQYGKISLNAPTKTGLDAGKTNSKKFVQQTAEVAGELIENKIAERTVKPKPVSYANKFKK